MSQIFVIYILLKKNKNHWWNQRTACQNLDSYPKTVSNKDETEKRPESKLTYSVKCLRPRFPRLSKKRLAALNPIKGWLWSCNLQMT